MQVTDVQDIIKTALGLDDASDIKVIDVKFSRATGIPEEEEVGGLTNYLAIARQASMGTMAVCAFLAFRMLSGSKNKAAKVNAKRKGKNKGGAEALAAGEIAGGTAAALPGETEGASEQLVVRRQIAAALQNDPERVRQLFASWLEERS